MGSGYHAMPEFACKGGCADSREVIAAGSHMNVSRAAKRFFLAPSRTSKVPQNDGMYPKANCLKSIVLETFGGPGWCLLAVHGLKVQVRASSLYFRVAGKT